MKENAISASGRAALPACAAWMVRRSRKREVEKDASENAEKVSKMVIERSARQHNPEAQPPLPV